MHSNTSTLKIIFCSLLWLSLSFISIISRINGLPTIYENKLDNNSVRVLVINNTNFQNAIEEAVSLSVDLPSINNTTNGASSYEHISLASLTLSQRGPRSALAEEPTSENNNDNKTKQPSTVNNDQKQQQQTNYPPDPWRQLYLPRLKPTWLNVSQQFKLTGSSIKEIEYMMPAEYLLRTAFDSPILLKTKLGILEGVRSIKFNKHLYTFLSVPYAKAPINELRFKLPQPIEKWEGIMQATKWPPFCVQPSMTLSSKSSPVHVLTQMMSEDCLYINIWTPSLKLNSNSNNSNKRPVMAWIHGGAFQYGGISVDENDGSALAILGDVVVVTFNYRVSAFGFLNANNPSNGPNNVGLYDQRLAMKWIQENIKQFGGDPQQVTLFGESAGGHSVGLHMVSPESWPYFKRAILQSGVPISFLRSYDVNNDNTGATVAEGVSSIMMAKRLKCYVSPYSNGPDIEERNTSTDNNSTTSLPDFSNLEKQNSTTTSTTIGTKIYTNETMPITESDATDLLSEQETIILNDQTLECMRSKSSLDILRALGAPGNAGFFPTGNDLKGFFPNGPIMSSFDPDNLRVGPQKDYLIGTNSDEGTFMLHYGMPKVFPAKTPPTVSNIDDLKLAMTNEIERLAKEASLDRANKSLSEESESSQNGGAQAHLYKPLLRTSSSILEGFMPKSHVRILDNGTIIGNTSVYSREAEFGKNIGSLVTDIIFLCPARSLARTLSESGRNVYFYLFTHRDSLSPYHDWIGVSHHDEVQYVFGRPLRMADVQTGKDIDMSQKMIKLWSHFARTGQMLDQLTSGLKWPTYGQEDGNYMILAADSASIGQRYHDKVCNIYDTVISVHLQDT